jgi:hypothetical protein
LHGNADGSIPATFSIIYMVRLRHDRAYEMAAKIVTHLTRFTKLDWLETFSNHSTAQKEGICTEVT